MQKELMITHKYADYVSKKLTQQERLEALAEEASGLTRTSLKLIRAEGWSQNVINKDKNKITTTLFARFIRLQMVMRTLVSDDVWKMITDSVDGISDWERWSKRLGYEENDTEHKD